MPCRLSSYFFQVLRRTCSTAYSRWYDLVWLLWLVVAPCHCYGLLSLRQHISQLPACTTFMLGAHLSQRYGCGRLITGFGKRVSPSLGKAPRLMTCCPAD